MKSVAPPGNLPMRFSALSALFLVAVNLPAAGQQVACPGDCDGDGSVAVDEIVTAIDDAFAADGSAACGAADRDADGVVRVDEISIGLAAALAGCPGLSEVLFVIESRDRIVSEDGELELLQGFLELESLSLYGREGEAHVAGPIRLDLGAEAIRAPASATVPQAGYEGVATRFAAPDDGSDMLDVRVRRNSDGAQVRVRSPLVLGGESIFPEGARLLGPAAPRVVRVRLTGLFFYLSPIHGAQDGVTAIDGGAGNFLGMDLVNLFTLP